MPAGQQSIANSRRVFPRWLAAALLLITGLTGCQNFQLPRIDPSGQRIFLPPGAPSAASPYANTPYGQSPPYNPAIAPNQQPLPGTTVIAPPVLSAPETPAPSALPPGYSSPMVTSPLQTPPPVVNPGAQPPALPPAGVPVAPYLPPAPLAPAPMVAPILPPSSGSQVGVNLQPNSIVAPVGSEVVMVVSLCGGEGYLVSNERVEWMISRDSVGQFVSPGEREGLDLANRFQGLPKKIDAFYVINKTLHDGVRLDRGTATPIDDVEVQPGQAWVTVTSPVVGRTLITAFAPNVPEWDRRQQSATIQWVEPQLNGPPPASGPIGAPQASGIGIRVVQGQSPAAVGSAITYRIEITNPSPALIRNVVVTDTAPRSLSFVNSTPLANSSPSGQEWRLGDLGPGQLKTVDVVYNIAQPVNQFEYCANVTADDGLANKSCINTAVGSGPIGGVGSTVPALSPLDVKINGPATAQVGSNVRYEVTVTNNGSTPATGLIVTNNFDAGLEHSVSASPIERDLKDLQPGQSQSFSVQFKVTRPGQLCQQINVVGSGNVRANGRNCLTALDAAVTPSPFDSSQGGVTDPTRPGRSIDSPPAAQGGAIGAQFSVRKTGPATARVNETVEFLIEVTNTGDVTLNNVRITDNYEQSLEPVEASEGHLISGGSLVWTVPSLAPGKTVTRRIVCRCLQAVRSACNRVSVTAEGLAALGDDACVDVAPSGRARDDDNLTPSGPNPIRTNEPDFVPRTQPRAGAGSASATGLTVTVGEQTDPIRVGSDTVYQIVVSNKSDANDRQVMLRVYLPETMSIRGVRGPIRAKILPRSAEFDPIAELRAGESITLELNVRAETVGSGRVSAEVTSQSQRSSIQTAESTEVIK